jgi:hypothetical protein
MFFSIIGLSPLSTGNLMLYESSSKDQKRILLMAISLMIAVSIIVLGLTLWMLYRSNFEQRVEGLQAMIRGQVALIESVARFDRQLSQNEVAGGAGAATFLQVTEAYSSLGEGGGRSCREGWGEGIK